MKDISKISVVVLLLILIYSCKKERPTPPTIITTPLTDTMVIISYTTATFGGYVTNDGGAPIISRGVCWSTIQNPTVTENHTIIDGSGIGQFNSDLTGLVSNTDYYIVAYATNSAGTGYGNEISFTTLQVAVPVLSTSKITLIRAVTASSGGDISSEGGAPVSIRGVCWSTTPNPTTADNKTTDEGGMGNFVSSLTGLSPEVTYYVRAYAVNSAGTGYGNEISFTTYGSVTDIDLNVYSTVTIGTQTWMGENLKTTKYRDGSVIPNITDDVEWFSQTTGAYCWYNNDQITYEAIYGALYNYYTTVDSRNLCPTGWHVPSDDEWTILKTYLGVYAGNKLRETGIWPVIYSYKMPDDTPYIDSRYTATNESGFSAIPSGLRTRNDFKCYWGSDSWWSTTEYDTSYAFERGISAYGLSRIASNKKNGYSIRCIKD